MSDPRNAARPLAIGFATLALVTYALIVMGALVRANGAGLACPDWPLCFGRVVPEFDTRIALEWGHRLLAGGIAAGLLALSLAGWRRKELRRWLAPRLGLAWGLLLTQALFGALTVWFLLAPWSVTVHLLLGNAFCALLLWLSADLGEAAATPVARAGLRPGLRAALAAVFALLLCQMLLGGLVASHAAGLACADFPTCDGRSLAPTLSGLVGLHVLHRIAAFSLLVGFIALAWLARGDERIGRLARLGLRLVVLQIAVGVANVMLRLPVEVTALHSALATAIVLTGALMVREALRVYGEMRIGSLAHRVLEAG